MKKILLIAFLAVSALTASAQLEAGHYSLTPYVGAGCDFMSNFTYTDSDGKTQKFGSQVNYIGGVDAQYNISRKVGVSLGAGWLYYETEKVTKNVPENCQARLSYLNIPLLAHIQFTNQLSFKAGVQTSFLLLAKYSNSVKVTDTKKPVNVSIPFGVSWKFNMPFELGLQYNIPVMKVNKEGSLDEKASGLFLTLGYRFDL